MIGSFSLAKVGSGEHAPGIHADQMRPVGPVLDEFAVVPAVFDHHAGHAKRQRAVGSGPDAQPLIGLGGEASMARIDGDELGTSGLGGGDARTVWEPGDGRIMAPQHNAVAMLEIGDRQSDAEAVRKNHFLGVAA